MDWRRWAYGLAGGGLVAVGLLSAGTVAMAAALATATGDPVYAFGPPWYGGTVSGVLLVAGFVAGLAPVFAAGAGVYTQRYGAVGAVLGTLYAVGGVLLARQMTQQGPSTSGLLLGATALLWLALWPLSVAVGYFEYGDRREESDDWLRRAGHALQGPLFPIAVVAGIGVGAWTVLITSWNGSQHAGLVLFTVFTLAPFVAVLAVRLATRDSVERAGDLSPTERALWTLGTQPLLSASVGVGALLGGAILATWIDLLSGPIIGPGLYSLPVTPARLLGAALLPPLLGAVYVLTTVDDLLTDWRETVAGRRPEHAGDLTDPAGVTFLDARDRIARIGPPRSVRADHLLLGEERVRVVEDARLDLVTREVESVGESRSFAADEPLAAREGDRVHVETADGEVEFTPYGDPDRLVAAVDRRYDAEVRAGRQPGPHDRRDRPAADD